MSHYLVKLRKKNSECVAVKYVHFEGCQRQSSGVRATCITVFPASMEKEVCLP